MRTPNLRRLLAACGLALATAGAPAAHAAGGTLVVGSTAVPRHLDGAVQSGLATAMPSTQLFASPLRFDDKWNPQPYLAESWELSPDNRTLTLHLRKNAVFHDGQPVTSADVAFSLMAIKANHPFSTMLAPLEKVDTPDAHTAILRMSQPHPAILLAMSPALAPILPKHIYDDGTDLKNHPRNTKDVVGSGPFKLVEFVPGQRVVLERFDKFFLPGRPKLDRVIFNYMPDLSSLTLSLERGDIQMLPSLSSPVELRRLQGNPNLVVTDKGYEGIGAINWLAFNLRREPLSKLEVRQAIAHAVDRNFISKALHAGFSKPAIGPIVSGSPFAAKDLAPYALDLKKAAALLDAAGYPAKDGGERLKLTVDYIPGSDDQQKNVAEYLRSQLKKIGIAVEVRASADFPSWAKRIASGDFDMTMDNVFNWGDPVIGVARTYLSSNIKPIIWTNTQAYANPAVDKLLESAAVEPDPQRRKQLYVDFQKAVTHDLPILFINEVPYRTVTSKRVGNVPTSIWGPLAPYDEVTLQ
ncbi:extracellular substrate-binding protein%2Cfamily 5 [Bordetella ansorpii]|uniref:Extracellular substrate-binding protein,family 5 n=1 Tax=Bordetella ansorpii TaxID=288768 RepID=A0A146AG82_9BORD|nr:ABC transporter substrate-binding protein [Bordetella ansorpii]CZZ87322.1 extracellular substrate-binding protein%2Cfamily 5 [Bordetella ansorpii]SAI65503.1 extracellular substrate-binding protein%2Cfamily 5 [Bordetella ansorpii]